MIDDDSIRLVIVALKENFEKNKQEYETSLRQIQEICPHNKLDKYVRLNGGNKCLACGKMFYE